MENTALGWLYSYFKIPSIHLGQAERRKAWDVGEGTKWLADTLKVGKMPTQLEGRG